MSILSERVHNYIEFDMMTLAIIEDDFDFYAGPWLLCKESSEEKARRQKLEDLDYQNKVTYSTVDLPFQRQMAQQQQQNYMADSAAQREFERQYLAMQQGQFKTQNEMAKEALARQYGVIDPVVASMKPYLEGNVGFDPNTLNLMNDESMSQISGGYDDANAMLKARILAQSGGMPLGGPEIGRMAELESGLANSTSTARRNISLENARQMLTNKFNAGGVIMGAGAQFGGNVGTGTSAAGAAAGGYGAGASGYGAGAPVMSTPGMPTTMAPPKPPGFWSSFGKTLLGAGVQTGLGMLGGWAGGMGASSQPSTGYGYSYGMPY